MKVLHVTSGIDPRGGGTTTALAAMAIAQQEFGLDVSAVSTYATGLDTAAVDQLRNAGIHVELIGPHGRFLAHHPDIARRLPATIEASDIVHIHALWESIQHQAATIARRQGKPYVFTTHGMLDPWSLSQSRLRKRLYLALRLRRDLSFASAIHFTNDIERQLTNDLHLPTPTIIEKYIIDLSDFDRLPPPGTFRATYPQIGERPIVLFFGRIHPKKGLDLLLPAFARISNRAAFLVLAGPVADAYRAELVSRSRELGIDTRMIFTGMLQGIDRVAALADATVFTLPSYQENVGIAVVEAIAARTPVVISDRVNIHPDIARGNVGEVVPTEVTPLAAALERGLVEQPDAAERCQAFIREHYDRMSQAKRWATHYGRLIAGGR